jgi:hypothetical protein
MAGRQWKLRTPPAGFVKLPAVFQFIFGCRHRHLSRTFTIKHRTYKVCFDCGREFDLPDAHAPKRINISSDAGSKPNPYEAR